MFLHTLQLAHLPAAQLPVVLAVGDGIILNLHCREVTHQFFVLKLVQAEAIASLHVVVVVLDVGDDTFIYLQLHILGRGVLLLVLIHVLEVLSNHGAMWDDVGGERIAQG